MNFPDLFLPIQTAVMNRKGRTNELEPFHERHKSLLIFCTLAGLKTRAVDRIQMSDRTRSLLRFTSIVMQTINSSIFIGTLLPLIFWKFNNDPYEFIHLVMFIACCTHGVFRQYYMLKNSDKFDELYTAWDEMFGKDTDWKTRQKAVEVYYDSGKKAIGFFGLLTTIMLIVYSTSSFSSGDKVLKIPTVVPYRHQSPDFEIMASYFVVAIFVFGIAVCSSQMLLITPILWELGEITRLQKRLAEIYHECETITEAMITVDGFQLTGETYTNLGIMSVKSKMTLWVEQHKKLITFHKMSANLNNFEFGMEVVAVFIEACGIAILYTSDYYNPVHQFTSACTFTAYFALFYYSCARCSELADLSMNVVNKAFAENWWSTSLKMKKRFLMIVTRTIKPLDYCGAYVFRMDVITFSKIMQSAYSTFNVVNNMMNRDSFHY